MADERREPEDGQRLPARRVEDGRRHRPPGRGPPQGRDALAVRRPGGDRRGYRKGHTYPTVVRRTDPKGQLYRSWRLEEPLRLLGLSLDRAGGELNRWVFRASHSRIPEIVELSKKNQETPPRHPAHHRTWLLQRQARGVQQQDQGHHPHGLRLPPRHQPHRPDHAPMQRTRHPTTTTHNLTHKKQQKPLKYPTFRPHPPQGSNQALQKARHRFREESAARFHKGTQSQDHTHRSIPISTRT